MALGRKPKPRSDESRASGSILRKNESWMNLGEP